MKKKETLFLKKTGFLVPLLLFLSFFFLYAINPNDRIEDSVFVYFPEIWSFPHKYLYNATFATPYHVLYEPSVWLTNKVINFLTGKEFMFIESAYWQSIFFGSAGIMFFYLLLREIKRSIFVSLVMTVFLGFSYVFWTYVRMPFSGGIIFLGTVLALFSQIYLYNRSFSKKAFALSTFSLILAYLCSQTAVLTIPVAFIYCLKEQKGKKNLKFYLNYFNFIFITALLLLTILFLTYKYQWGYEDYNNFFPRILGKDVGFSLVYKLPSLKKFFSETFYNVTVSIFGIYSWLKVITPVFYLLLLSIFIKNRSNSIVWAFSFFFLILFFLAPTFNRESAYCLKYWIFFLIPVYCILSIFFEDIVKKNNLIKRKSLFFYVVLILAFLTILHSDLKGEQYPETWNYRSIGRGVLPKSHKEFYDFIKKNIPKDSVVLHDREFYYADIVTFTQIYSRRLDYALKNDLITKGDEIAPYDPKRPIFLISAFEFSDIYIFKDRAENGFHFQFERKIPGFFDGYNQNLYRLVDFQKTADFLSSQLLSVYHRDIKKEQSDDYENKESIWLPVFSGYSKDRKFLIIAPKFIVRFSGNNNFKLQTKKPEYYSLREKLVLVSYPERSLSQ